MTLNEPFFNNIIAGTS